MDDAEQWDEVYADTGDGTHVWSGRPNGSLVAEVADLEPGTALDVGCGEGADAVWLAQEGWVVTGLEPSGIALDRARAAVTARTVDVTFVHGGLLEFPTSRGPFDLVTAQYPALRKEAGDHVARLLDLVAPGGTLLLVHHDPDGAHDHGHADTGTDHDDEHDHGGFDPDDYVLPSDVVPRLGPEWDVLVDELRDRPGPLPEDARHVRDAVLRAVRLR